MNPENAPTPEINDIKNPSPQRCSDQIIFYSSRSNNGDLYRFDPSSLETSGFIVADSAIGAPRFNSKTNSVIFTQQGPEGRNLYSKNLLSQQTSFLMPNPAGEEVPDWSPIENMIVYSLKDHLQHYSLIVRDLDNGEELVLFENALQVYNPVWSPDGLQIAFVLTDSTRNADIAIINTDGTHFENQTNNLKLNGHPSWSPDGRKILFYISNNGNADLYSLEVETKDLTRLTFDSANQLVGRYSPDGTKIAYGGVIEDNWEVFIMNSNGIVKAIINIITIIVIIVIIIIHR